MDELLAHWPFVVAALIFSTVGQVVKATVYTAANCIKYQGTFRGTLLWWGRKTLPLQPVVVGALLGLIQGLPVSPGVGNAVAAHMLYFAGAGICSTWFFSVLRGVLKQRGIDLDLGTETVPPAKS